MIDELAHAAGQDPAQYRIALLDGKGKNDGGAQRLRNTLLAAMGMAGYGPQQLPKGEGMGVARGSSPGRAPPGRDPWGGPGAGGPAGGGQGRKQTLAPPPRPPAPPPKHP